MLGLIYYELYESTLRVELPLALLYNCVLLRL